jgi:hypothetical protein
MSQKNKARHLSKCEIAAENATIITESSAADVSMQKRKEEAEQILYLKRV